jgi:hypothetical protein
MTADRADPQLSAFLHGHIIEPFSMRRSRPGLNTPSLKPEGFIMNRSGKCSLSLLFKTAIIVLFGIEEKRNDY